VTVLLVSVVDLDQMFVSLQNLYGDALARNVVVPAGRVFEKYLGFDEVMTVGPHDGISVLVRTTRIKGNFLSAQVRTQ
jgi:hypothetical protein